MARTKKKKPYEIGELDQYLFGQGTHYDLYKKMGSHLVTDGKKKGTYFAVWAPNAKSVSVVLITGIGTRIRWCGKIRLEFIPALFRGLKRI